MLRRLILLFAILPAAALADPQGNPDGTTISKEPGATNAAPPPPPVTLSANPRSASRAHSCWRNYPQAAMKAGIEGTTVLSFTVTAQGTVAQVAVKTSSGNADLDHAAVACASAWTYKPGTKKGAPVDTPWQATVAWKLHEDWPLTWAPSEPCTKFATVTAAMLKGIAGRSWIGYRVMADGTAVSPAILASSGNAALDRAAESCVAARRFIVAARPIPPEGLMQNIVVDWNYELASSK